MMAYQIWPCTDPPFIIPLTLLIAIVMCHCYVGRSNDELRYKRQALIRLTNGCQDAGYRFRCHWERFQLRYKYWYWCCCDTLRCSCSQILMLLIFRCCWDTDAAQIQMPADTLVFRSSIQTFCLDKTLRDSSVNSVNGYTIIDCLFRYRHLRWYKLLRYNHLRW